MLDRMTKVGLRLCVLLAIGYQFAPSSWAQQMTVGEQTTASLNSFTAIRGNYDQEVPTPQFVIVSAGRRDEGALKEINAFRAITGIQSWTDLAGEGMIRYGNDQDSEEHARLEIRQPGEFRLDMGGNVSEQRTVLIAQSRGTWHRGGELSKAIDSRDAAVGLFAFPRIEERSFPDAMDLLIDQGTISIDGSILHRITVERPPLSIGNANAFTSWVTIDLYFNLNTHLLEKSATCVHGDGPATMLRVLTYSKYQKVDVTLLPMMYRETLNGQIAWTLQLNELHINTGLSAQDFQF